MESQNDTVTVIGGAQGHRHSLYISSLNRKSTWTAKEEHDIKLHTFYNYKINIFAGKYKRN